MPDADDYLRRANALLALSLRAANPVVGGRFLEVAQEYLARAVALRLAHGLSPLPKPRAASARPRAPLTAP